MRSRVQASAAEAVRREVEFAPRPSLIRGLEQRRAEKNSGMAAATAWRESRRCPACGAIGYRPCAHRPNGAGGPEARAVSAERMPFKGHRTQRQVRQDQERSAMLRGLGRS